MNGFDQHLLHPRANATLAHRIWSRLIAGLVIGVVVSVIVIVVGLLAYMGAERDYQRLDELITTVQAHVSNLYAAMNDEALHFGSYLITGEQESITNRNLAREDVERELGQLQEVYGLLPGMDPADLQDLMTTQDDYHRLSEDILSRYRAGQEQAAIALFEQRSEPIILKLQAAQRTLAADLRMLATQIRRDFSAHIGFIIAIVAAFGLAALISASWLLTRLLTPALPDLDYFERALVESVQSSGARPIRLPMSGTNRPAPIFQAYNALIARLEDGETARLDFVSSAAHALRTRLASIVGYAAVLEDSTAPIADDARNQYVQIILKQARQMGQVVEDMVTVALVDLDRLDVSLAPLRLGPLAKAVVDEARQHSGREIQLEDQLGAALVMGDALRLQDVLARVIDNALKFSPPDTPVRLTLRSASTSGWIEIAIVDQGIGIAEADRPLLFRRFGRIKNKQTQAIPGSGLGLYITRYIVERHHGQIAAHSQPGQGATFIVTLPAAESAVGDAVLMAEKVTHD